MIKLKKAVRSDCILLHKLQTASFASLLQKYQDFDTNPGAEPIEKIYTRFDQPYTDYYLILLNEQVIGMLRVCDHEDRCRLSPICILPEHQGRGYAALAMQEMEKCYPKAKIWDLDTILQEDRLCRFYEKLGYQRTGEYRRIKEGMDLVFYRKTM